MTLMKPIKDSVFIAKLAVTIHPQHDDDEIMDYLLYPNVKWSGRYDEEFVYWTNPEFQPGSNRHPEGVAEYTVRYHRREDMEADAETRKWFIEGMPDGLAEWRTASVMEVTSHGKAQLLDEQAMQYHDDNVPYPVPESDGLWQNGVKIGQGA